MTRILIALLSLGILATTGCNQNSTAVKAEMDLLRADVETEKTKLSRKQTELNQLLQEVEDLQTEVSELQETNKLLSHALEQSTEEFRQLIGAQVTGLQNALVRIDLKNSEIIGRTNLEDPVIRTAEETSTTTK